jgi:predicted DNA-binding transcriptional regulator AlpA
MMVDQRHDELVDMKRAMKLLCIKSRTSVYKYAAENPAFPKPYKLNGAKGRVKFKASELFQFIESLKSEQA